jgi:preprotein translocase subunit SecE
MTKTLLVAALLSSFAAVSFAQASAPMAADGASAPAKHMKAKKAKKAKKARKSDEPSSNPFVFVFNYLKQVVAELRKVIWPNRKQMGSYTSVVLAFLVYMVTFIGLVDLGLAKLVLWVFG